MNEDLTNDSLWLWRGAAHRDAGQGPAGPAGAMPAGHASRCASKRGPNQHGEQWGTRSENAFPSHRMGWGWGGRTILKVLNLCCSGSWTRSSAGRARKGVDLPASSQGPRRRRTSTRWRSKSSSFRASTTTRPTTSLKRCL